MSFSSVFNQVFDIAYGKAICQYLDPEDVATMYEVNIECAETIAEYVKNNNILVVDQNGCFKIKHRKSKREYITKHRVYLCQFTFTALGGLCNFVTLYQDTPNQFEKQFNIYTLHADDMAFLWIKYTDYKLKCLRIAQEKKRISQEKERIAQENQKAYIAHTLKPKTWSNFKLKV
jgi:hypothetical protein